MADEAAGEAGLRHAALLYRGADDLTSAAGRFIEQGVASGSPVLVVLPPSSLALMADALSDLGSAVTVIDMSDAGANPGRLIALLHSFAGSHPRQPLRILQEPAWAARSRAELGEVIRHEMLLNLALAGRQVQLLCPYSTDLDGEVLAGALAAHPAVVAQDGWARNLAYEAGLHVNGADALALDPPPSGAVSLTYRAEQSKVRTFAAEQARQAGVTEQRLVDVIIAVGELTGNTLAHTLGPGTLTTWTADGEFVCQVADSGEIADPLAGRIRPDPASTGRGRGLWVAHQVSDLLEVRSGRDGSMFRAHFRL